MRCVAVPVWNHESRVIAALSLSTLTSRVDDAELARFREQLQQAGLELSRGLRLLHLRAGIAQRA